MKTTDTRKIICKDEESSSFFLWIPILMFVIFFFFCKICLSLFCNIIMGYLFSHFIFGWQLLENNECFNSPLFLWQYLNNFFIFVDLYQTSVELNLKLFIHFICLFFFCKALHYKLNSKLFKVPWRIVFLC